MTGRRRLDRIESALACLDVDRPLGPIEVLALRDPATLTDAEAVEVWRHYAKQWTPRPAPFSAAEQAAIARMWRELRA
jgi:hypothetical protein